MNWRVKEQKKNNMGFNKCKGYLCLTKIYLLLSKNKIIIISLITTSILTLFLNRIDNKIAGSNNIGAVYLQLSFSKMNFELITASWGIRGINLFLETVWVNFLYPLSYAVLLSSAPAYFSKKKKNFNADNIAGIDIIYFLLPFIAAIFDYINNLLIVIIFTKRLFLPSLIFTASIAALIKWIIIMFSLTVILKKYFNLKKDRALPRG